MSIKKVNNRKREYDGELAISGENKANEVWVGGRRRGQIWSEGK